MQIRTSSEIIEYNNVSSHLDRGLNHSQLSAILLIAQLANAQCICTLSVSISRVMVPHHLSFYDSISSNFTAAGPTLGLGESSMRPTGLSMVKLYLVDIFEG